MHLYDLEGKARHTHKIETGANKGKLRPSRLTDARKHKLYPSVTEIISMADKKTLTSWKIRQALVAFCNADFAELGIGRDSDKINHAVKAMESIGDIAAARGTDIHEYVENYINGKESKYEEEEDYKEVFVEACKEIGADVSELIAEQSFVILDYGYGGSVDLYSNNIIIDIKTKDTVGNKKDPEKNDDYCMQLSAYRMGLGLGPKTRLINLFLSRDEHKATWVEYTQEESFRAWNMFVSLNEYWRAKNKYDPTEH